MLLNDIFYKVLMLYCPVIRNQSYYIHFILLYCSDSNKK